MNANGAIPIVKRCTLESDMSDYVSENSGYYRVYRYFTTKVNDQTGTQKFSLSKNTITFLKKSNLVSDIVHNEFDPESNELEAHISLKEVDGHVKHYLIEQL